MASKVHVSVKFGDGFGSAEFYNWFKKQSFMKRALTNQKTCWFTANKKKRQNLSRLPVNTRFPALVPWVTRFFLFKFWQSFDQLSPLFGIKRILA